MQLKNAILHTESLNIGLKFAPQQTKKNASAYETSPIFILIVSKVQIALPACIASASAGWPLISPTSVTPPAKTPVSSALLEQSTQPCTVCKRRPGTCITGINDHLFEGRYLPMWPDGKKRSRNICAHTCRECEDKLQKLIMQMKKEIADIKAGKNPDNIPCGKSKKKAIAAYMRANPQVSIKLKLQERQAPADGR